jgi:hypothetical protein
MYLGGVLVASNCVRASERDSGGRSEQALTRGIKISDPVSVGIHAAGDRRQNPPPGERPDPVTPDAGFAELGSGDDPAESNTY